MAAASSSTPGGALRILPDEKLPAALRHLIGGHQVSAAYVNGWTGVSNGDLISAAEPDGFEVLITADRNIRYQQNLTGRQLALIVVSTNIWPGDYVEVAPGRPGKRRRPCDRAS